MEITDKQWDVLCKRLDNLEASISDDRKDIDKIQINLATIKEQNERILSMQVRGQEKVTDTVHKAVSEAIEPTNEIMEELADKAVMKFDKKKVENLSIMRRIQEKVKSWR